jgi:hypothetical protein
MKRIFLSILAVGTALALAAPVWAGGEVLSDSELAGIEAAGVDIENSCALCYQVNKEIDVDVNSYKSFNKKYVSKKYYNSRKYYRKTTNKNGSWRDMDFDNGILIGGDVKDNNAVNFIMANGGGGSLDLPYEEWDKNGGKNGQNGNGGNEIAAQNNFLMIKGDSGLGAHAKGVNQINNAFGGVYVNQSDSTYVSVKDIDVDISDSFNYTYTKDYSSTKNYSYSKYVDIDVNVYKSSYRSVK